MLDFAVGFVPSHLHETVLHRGLDLTSLDGDFDSLSCSSQDLTDDQALQIWHKGHCPKNNLLQIDILIFIQKHWNTCV